ncbi:MAG: beta-carotene hydroxylase [Alphaproteobacteria bacterium]|nr:beta-carotene hydroxylase [Alphaproteobacteria bacterium]
MTALAFIAIVVATILGMEAFAWTMHRYVMHGALWSIHKSHHSPREGAFELNDLFGVVFAIPSIVLIYIGVRGSLEALAVGVGIFGYGAIYFFLHDMLVHRRVDLGMRPKRGYLARITQAHRLHHAVESKEGCVSFGFIFAPPPQKLKAMLSRTESARMRAGAGRKATTG